MKQEPENEGGGRGRGRKEHKRRPRVIGFTYASSEVHFRSTKSQTFYQSIMIADDTIKCRCANLGMTGQVGGFQNTGDCLQAFPSFLPHPLPALLLAPFLARSLIQNPRHPLPLSSLRERGKREKRNIQNFNFKALFLVVSTDFFPRGRALRYFLGGYVPPGTPNWHPFLKKISPKIDTPF